ncbi:MAG: aromatic-ring-hydroxylating dioxygenase subunit beta [Halioglobus sp.]
MLIEQRLAVVDLVITESACLDEKNWAGWLDLYTEDAEYWIPAWDDEHTLTTDPQCELSLIYYGSRAGLEDRVYRLETGLSLASSPLPRTCHTNSNFRVEQRGEDVLVHSSWVTHSYRMKKSQIYYGHQTHTMRRSGGEWKISGRYIVLQNDSIDSVLDVYSV